MEASRRAFVSGAIWLPLLGLSGLAAAQNYPAKPIRIIVPYPPGGTNDAVARILGQKLTEQLGQPVVVENKAGASGNIGAESVAKAPADGYTLILVTTGHSIHPSLYPKLAYDITTDLAPVSELTSGPMLVMVNPQLPVKNLADLIALAKAKPGQVNFGSAGNGSTTHLAAEQICSLAGVKMNHIPYKGSAPAMADVIAGNAQLVLDLMFSAMPQVKGGRLRAIAITGRARSPLLPEVPTVAESGLPGFEAMVWNGLMAPASTPKEVIARLNAEIKKALAGTETKDLLQAQGFAASWSTPEQFGALIRSEIERWKKVVKSSGATIG